MSPEEHKIIIKKIYNDWVKKAHEDLMLLPHSLVEAEIDGRTPKDRTTFASRKKAIEYKRKLEKVAASILDLTI